MIEKRHVCVSDELLRSNPYITDYKSPGSARTRAALEAIADWGSPACDITHLFVTTLSGRMPGADFEVVKLLGSRSPPGASCCTRPAATAAAPRCASPRTSRRTTPARRCWWCARR
jgi:hypothetical protein